MCRTCREIDTATCGTGFPSGAGVRPSTKAAYQAGVEHGWPPPSPYDYTSRESCGWREWLTGEKQKLDSWWRHQMEHFPRYWPFVRGIHLSPVNSPHKGQWRGALIFSLICVWINGWVNNHEAGDLRRYRAHYDVTVMSYKNFAKLI